MSDDLVRKLREARYVAFDECGDYDLAQEAATALTEARAENARLRAGINGVVNFQSGMTRSQVRESCAEILGNKTVGLNNQSPFAEAMLGYKARADAAESALAEAVEVMRPVADVTLPWGDIGAGMILASDVQAARTFVQQHEGKK
ncbi:MAG: hypothetical protein WBB07_24375 [Mycobacterium sp.]